MAALSSLYVFAEPCMDDWYDPELLEQGVTLDLQHLEALPALPNSWTVGMQSLRFQWMMQHRLRNAYLPLDSHLFDKKGGLQRMTFKIQFSMHQTGTAFFWPFACSWSLIGFYYVLKQSRPSLYIDCIKTLVHYLVQRISISRLGYSVGYSVGEEIIVRTLGPWTLVARKSIRLPFDRRATCRFFCNVLLGSTGTPWSCANFELRNMSWLAFSGLKESDPPYDWACLRERL